MESSIDLQLTQIYGVIIDLQLTQIYGVIYFLFYFPRWVLYSAGKNFKKGWDNRQEEGWKKVREGVDI